MNEINVKYVKKASCIVHLGVIEEELKQKKPLFKIVYFLYADYPEKDSQELAIDVLPSCHHPLVVAVNKRAWVKIVSYLGHDPKKLVSLYANNLKNKYICGYEPSEVSSNLP